MLPCAALCLPVPLWQGEGLLWGGAGGGLEVAMVDDVGDPLNVGRGACLGLALGMVFWGLIGLVVVVVGAIL